MDFGGHVNKTTAAAPFTRSLGEHVLTDDSFFSLARAGPTVRAAQHVARETQTQVKGTVADIKCSEEVFLNQAMLK